MMVHPTIVPVSATTMQSKIPVLQYCTVLMAAFPQLVTPDLIIYSRCPQMNVANMWHSLILTIGSLMTMLLFC